MFKPSRYRPHYVFNIRDLAQIFAGMRQCTPEFVKNSDDLINLFTHECNRVIHDRLVEEDEKRDYFEILHNALRIHCKVRKFIVSRNRFILTNRFFLDV